MEWLTATFEGEKMTIANVWQRLQQPGYRGNYAIFVEPKNLDNLARQIDRRDCYPDTDEMQGIPLRITGLYGYGFDICIGESNFEIDCESGATEIEVYLISLGSLTFLDTPPAEPEPEKLEVKTSVNVSSLTMDELADIVSTYDEIHADAIKELNNRLDTFRDKL
ncbi:hypothetical protein JIPhKp127_0012 [Klebsiella phage JIPh_Kp127]|uniref:Uncharacterized protein n=1 Tax=Klebsiella phage JIPh_Kp127 TaxID=2653645 RepID=A0A5P8PL17_9CAUD|nr:hypothetical protein JIPhKp127_0012 [Klebsiella phage JIPh_Kp127]